MKYVLLSFVVLFSSNVFAGVQSCGVVLIDVMLAGPRHGSMIHVSNVDCGAQGGWVCLDPKAEFISKEQSDRLHSFALAYHMANRPFLLHIYDNVFPEACGGYPLVEDIRTQ